MLTSAQTLLREQPRLDLLFVHLDLIDHTGHECDYGPSIPAYVAAVSETDKRVAALLATLRCGERPSRWVAEEDWLVVLTTDHGGADYTHEDGRPENRTNFLILQGSDVAPGEIWPAPLVVDVAPTVLAHLRVALSTSWHLDGRPVGLKLSDERGRAGCFIDLQASQDPLNLFPILPEELEEEEAEEAQEQQAEQAPAAHQGGAAAVAPDSGVDIAAAAAVDKLQVAQLTPVAASAN